MRDSRASIPISVNIGAVTLAVLHGAARSLKFSPSPPVHSRHFVRARRRSVRSRDLRAGETLLLLGKLSRDNALF